MRESAKQVISASGQTTSSRILHVTEALGGGIHSAIASWAAATPDMHHIVLAKARAGQATYTWPHNVTQSLHDTTLPGLFWKSVLYERKYRPHAVHLHSSKAGAFRIGQYRAKHVIYSPHCFAFERRDIGRFMRFAYRTIERLLAPRAVIATVSREEELLAQALGTRIRTALVPNYSQVEHQPLQVTSSSIVTVGRILPQKDPQFFMETVRNLQNEYKITWIGDGDPEVRSQLTDLGVQVTGWLPMDELVKLVGLAGLYLHTAAWEGSPLATLEAINAGTAVLSRDISSMRSIGYEVPSDTPQGLARAIERYFADDAYREQVFQTCRSIQAANSEREAADGLQTIYALPPTQAQETK